ncbi:MULTISPECIES: hypothetical protein [Dyella]|uniref:Uncharacterized protein n=2 Tax=Dyella TaxID=231454 RepID=A0A4R0YRB8_9GAMM|nr:MULTISPECIES: hypothetical protein [Dyella]TBR40575.1 hypothetical protein EYV96_10600 [Dyella terrae]TCI11843.1 hypothetical protein EZM97_00270 [Dyella soli]
MSIDIIVFLALDRAPNFDAWQLALGARHPEMHFAVPANLARDSGFLPMIVNGQTSGFYLFRNDPKEVAADYPAAAIAGGNFGVAYQLSFGAHANECVAASLSAEVLVTNFGGVAFDPQGGKVMSIKELQDFAAFCRNSLDP